MRKRASVNKSKSVRNFKKAHHKTRRINIAAAPMRGGFRL